MINYKNDRHAALRKALSLSRLVLQEIHTLLLENPYLCLQEKVQTNWPRWEKAGCITSMAMWQVWAFEHQWQRWLKQQAAHAQGKRYDNTVAAQWCCCAAKCFSVILTSPHHHFFIHVVPTPHPQGWRNASVNEHDYSCHFIQTPLLGELCCRSGSKARPTIAFGWSSRSSHVHFRWRSVIPVDGVLVPHG